MGKVKEYFLDILYQDLAKGNISQEQFDLIIEDPEKWDEFLQKAVDNDKNKCCSCGGTK